MEKIIDPIDRELIKSELTEDKFLRTTNVGGNSIYLITAHNAPNTMLEIGRLREVTFREAGGGTGLKVDIDEYDTAEVPFVQLLVWNEETEEIISSYRYIRCKDVPLDAHGYPHTPTSKLFRLSPKFIENEWQETIELGRSFVQPKYQGTNNPRLGLFSLDNLWDGLGALSVDNSDIKYFFGKMTMYDNYNRIARNWILTFLNKYFKGDENLVAPFHPVIVDPKGEPLKLIFKQDSFKEDFRYLNENIRNLKESIPPLIKSYISLSSTMRCFGASRNPEFGEVEEIAILITIADIYEEKKKRHILSYRRKKE